MMEVVLLVVCFVLVVFGLGPALMPAGFGTPLQRTAAGVAASLVLVYLMAFAIYVAHLPKDAHWVIPVAAVAVLGLRRRQAAALWRNREVAGAFLGWLALAAWLLGWQFAVFSYSGATWQGDWYEHYHRVKFFLGHWELQTRFLGTYSLAARPPLANLDVAAFLALAGSKFHLYQAACTLLASLVIWPMLLLQRAFARAGSTVCPGWLVLLLLALPALIQNAVFPWTKLPAAFFILTAIAFLAEPAPFFPRRLAGWLSLTGGMLAHYSTGPWVIALAVAELVRNPAILRRCVGRQGLVIGLACAGLFSTWLGWSLVKLGSAATFGSNSTVRDGEGLAMGQRLGQVGQNLYYTGVPAFLRKLERDHYRSSDPVVNLRDAYFNAVQSSAPMMAGAFGMLVAAALLWTERRQLDWRGLRYWGPLLGIGFVLGVAVHTEVVPLGLAQICLLPLALIAVAWLAARLPAHPVLRVIALLGAATDLALGILLHFGIQSFWLLRLRQPGANDWILAEILGHGGRTNFYARNHTIAQPYLHDLPGATAFTAGLLLAAILLAVMTWRRATDARMTVAEVGPKS
jgi:hypothetical protein